MPFQDLEETTPVARAPSSIERWLQNIFLDDWSLKLTALAITVVLWLAVTGQNQPQDVRVSGVQLNFVRPEGLEISNEPPGTLEVILTGSLEKLDRIKPRDLVATVDLRDQKAGERVVRLSLDRVKMDLREDVKIKGFQPATIPIRLEPIIEVSVNVEVKLEGKLPEGYEVVAVSANPSKIRLRGPSDRVNALHKAVTETVWLDDKRETFDLSHVEINIPDPKIDILDPAVDIHVEIADKKRRSELGFASGDDPLNIASAAPPSPRH